MKIKGRGSGLAWLIDVVGATLFAAGMAAAIGMLATDAVPSPWPVVAMLTGGALRGGAVMLVNRLSVHAAQRTSAAYRHIVMTHLLTRPHAAAPMLGVGAMLAVDHPITIEDYGVRFIPARIGAAVAPLAIVVIVAAASWIAAMILLATLLPFAVGMILAGSVARGAADRQLSALGQLSGLFVDRVRTLPIIRHFGAQDRIARQVAAATRDVAERTIIVLRAAFLSSAIMEFFAALSVALVAVYCGFALLHLLPFPVPERLTLPHAFFALAMAGEFYLPMRRLAAAYHEKQLGEAAEDAIALLLDPAPIAGPTLPFTGVSMRAVVIAWPGHRIGPVDLAIGQTGLIAVTGATGSGKTSMLAVIGGQITPAAGTVTPLDPTTIAWAAQRPLIVPGTLRDNLVLGSPDATDDTVDRTLVAVGLNHLVSTRSEGLALTLDHRGSGLSGGERRRLGLARAILSERPLLLCDEPTADLDDVSATQIIDLLMRIARNRAVIVATHDARLVALAQGTVAL